MGVRGLTTFIKNNEKKYLIPHKLHNCTVLMDGNCIASNLYIWSNIDPAFGGDYDKFAKYVKEFFKVLSKCKIKALVIFDGGYEQRKLKTVFSRLRDKYRSARDTRPLARSVTFPLFMRLVFREVLVELNIPFAQSDFEADDELAALARQLNCPVISNDSDFYIYDVLYIPFPSMDLLPTKLEHCSTDGPSHYIQCKIYKVELFINSFGGLDKNMLPLLAALLGNDYIKRSVFNAFYRNLRIPNGKTNPLQRRIKAVIDWLRNESFETATRKILGRMKSRSRRRVMGQLKKIVQGYITRRSVLIGYLGICTANETCEGDSVQMVDANVLDIVNELEEHIDAIQDVESNEPLPAKQDELNEYCDDACSSESDNELSEGDSVKGDAFLETTSFIEGNTDIPSWLLEYARKGKIQSCVIDILSLRQYFCPPQVEDYSLTPSHYISLPILNVIVGLLVDDSEHLFRYWTRRNSSLAWYTLEPSRRTVSSILPPCNDIMNTSDSARRKAILEITGVPVDFQLSHLPDEWHLFVVAGVFWLRNMKEPEVSEAHLHTIVMCLVAIHTIDVKLGVHRNNQTFSRKYKSLLHKTIESRAKEKNQKESKSPDPRSNNIPMEMPIPVNELARVSHEDCVLVFGSILPYHHLNDDFKSKPEQFCSFTIHAFAQLQSILYHLIVLNSILGFPFKELFVSHLYSGVFMYNMYSYLFKKTNIVDCVESLFQSAPSLLRLYKSLIGLLKEPLADIELQKNLKKSHKKKRRSKQQLPLPGDVEINKQEEDDDLLFYDENNIFSRLSINP